MQRGVNFRETRFSVDTLRECIKGFLEIVGGKEEYHVLEISLKGDTWEFDHIEDFYEEYREKFFQFHQAGLVVETTVSDGKGYTPPAARLIIALNGRISNVTVESASRIQINQILSLFHQRQDRDLLEPLPAKKEQPKLRPTVFIGHGHNPQWRHLKDHLSDLHSYQIQTYESGARAGHAVRDILEQLLRNNSFAILVMTAEDAGNEDGMRARQNVVHEAGLFQGRLGFDRAIVLEEEGIEGFSNLDGVNRIRFSPGNIRETYGEVLATLRREFGDSRLLEIGLPKIEGRFHWPGAGARYARSATGRPAGIARYLAWPRPAGVPNQGFWPELSSHPRGGISSGVPPPAVARSAAQRGPLPAACVRPQGRLEDV